MKKCFASGLFILAAFAGFAQEEKDGEEVKKGFKKENLFTGGTVTAGFSNGQTSLGIGPYFGYSLNRFLDVAVSLNYNYVSQRDNLEYGDKIRQSVIGPGAFLRVYPVKFLFAHAQYEQNFVKLKYIPADNSGYLPQTESYSAPSFLIGPGFAQGRGDGTSFYYISVLFDVAGNKNSPYVDELGRANPVFRAGVNIALFQSESGRDRYRKRDNY